MASKTMAKFAHVLQDAKHITERVNDAPEISIESFIGYTSVPVGLAGPLLIKNPDGTSTRTYAPIATSESAIIASCCRGCKASSLTIQLYPTCNRFCPSRAGSLGIHKPSCSSCEIDPNIVGSNVHVRFDYTCGDAAGQNMISIATQRVCDWLLASTQEMELVSSLKATWRRTKIYPGELSARLEVLRLSGGLIFRCEGGTRNAQFGSNINVANVTTGIFIATGQDAAAVAEGPFGHLTPEYDHESRQVKLTLYFPSLPVGTVGGGTAYETQREALGIL
ncbi:hypothetical protein PENNAL_c0036G10190 [Penicillium nalgiovense]|uniref:hydroxymethylglutaryl-CoA reductase (NADPH) n=1 Tax=Penicillium nalgiovense TaxID=60175 RepID=A0A1V6Y552_PENNA|nr:hypothetical protein PENNAL_c0036G10190 [Penicillium nalgiovense]